MLHLILIVLSGALIAGEPSALTEIDHVLLEATVDGKDSRGEGFATLVDNVRLWRAPFEQATFPNLQILRESPSAFRGDVFSIEGVLELQTPLGSRWEGVSEWFVRDGEGVPFTLYVVGDNDITVGSTMQTTARFYKTMSFEGRDNQIRLYPTFVTPSVAINYSIPSSGSFAFLFVVPLLGVASIVVFLVARSGKRKTHRCRITSVQTEDVIDAVAESSSMLSNDPAQALEVMYDRSEIEV